jgi:hypothetical protein
MGLQRGFTLRYTADVDGDETRSAHPELVMVPVPVDRLLDVYALLSRDHRRAQASTHPSLSETVWEESSIKRVMELLSKPAQDLITCLVQHAGQPVQLSDLTGQVRFDDGHRDEASLIGLLGPIRRNVNHVRQGATDLVVRTKTAEGAEALQVEPRIAGLIQTTAWRRRHR